MKRLTAFLVLLSALAVLAGCGQTELHMDTYRYDGYQNLQWGSAPDQAIRQLGLSKKQIDRLESGRMEDMPDGSFGYEITRTTVMFGIFTEGELYFSEGLYGIEPYTGVYGMKLTFREVPEWYTKPAGSPPGDDSYYRLDPEKLISEYDQRGLYNRNKTEGTWEDEHGSWKTVTWSCDATLSGLKAADKEAVAGAVACVREALGDEAADALMDAPLSSFTFYYDNDNDEDPYMYFDGFPASILYNAS